ncbi:MAG: hypothetical protein R6U17_00140 [Thermoplasmata archaeon]
MSKINPTPFKKPINILNDNPIITGIALSSIPIISLFFRHRTHNMSFIIAIFGLAYAIIAILFVLQLICEKGREVSKHLKLLGTIGLFLIPLLPNTPFNLNNTSIYLEIQSSFLPFYLFVTMCFVLFLLGIYLNKRPNKAPFFYDIVALFFTVPILIISMISLYVFLSPLPPAPLLSIQALLCIIFGYFVQVKGSTGQKLGSGMDRSKFDDILLPLRFGELFGIGIIMYISTYILAIVGGFSFLIGWHIQDWYLLFLLSSSYIFMFLVLVDAVRRHGRELEGKNLKIGGAVLFLLPLLFFVTPSALCFFFVFSIVVFYVSISLCMLGFNKLASYYSGEKEKKNTFLALSISFLSLIHILGMFSGFFLSHSLIPNLNAYLSMMVLLGIFGPMLCILSGYHSSKVMLEAEDYD